MSNEQYRELPTDEKLVTLFELMSNVSSVSTRLSRTEDKLVSVQCAMTRDQSRIKLLEYKSIDIGVINRRHNLIFRGLDEKPFEETLRYALSG